MKIAGIYKIQRIGTDQCYVGSSVDVAQRWRKHRESLSRGQHHAIRLQRSWKKDGLDAFVFRVLEVCASDKHILKLREQHWMDQLRPCFNTFAASYSAAGYCHTDEAKRKISAAGIGRRRSPEAIEKVAAARRGSKHTTETKAKMSAALKGRVMSSESVEARARALRGRPLTVEHAAKIGLANRGKHRTPEHRAAVSRAQTGRKRTPAQIEAVVAAHRGVPRSQETKDKIRASMVATLQAKREASNATSA